VHLGGLGTALRSQYVRPNTGTYLDDNAVLAHQLWEATRPIAPVDIQNGPVLHEVDHRYPLRQNEAPLSDLHTAERSSRIPRQLRILLPRPDKIPPRRLVQSSSGKGLVIGRRPAPHCLPHLGKPRAPFRLRRERRIPAGTIYLCHLRNDTQDS